MSPSDSAGTVREFHAEEQERVQEVLPGSGPEAVLEEYGIERIPFLVAFGSSANDPSELEAASGREDFSALHCNQPGGAVVQELPNVE